MKTINSQAVIPTILSSVYPGIRSGDVITLTPKMAQALKDGHMSNQQRPLKRRLVNMLVNQLVENRWILTGDTLKFDLFGKIIDGQHRIEACIVSGVSLQIAVFFGLHPDAYMMIDKTAARSASDVLAGFGAKNTVITTAIARAYLLFKNGIRAGMNGSEAPKIDRDDIVNFALEIDEKFVHTSMSLKDKHIKGLNILSGSEIGLFLMLFSETQGFDKAHAFLLQVCDPSAILVKNHPAQVLRNKLIEDLVSPKRVSITQRRSWIIRAWNDYVDGEKREFIRTVSDPEKNFPKIK